MDNFVVVSVDVAISTRKPTFLYFYIYIYIYLEIIK